MNDAVDRRKAIVTGASSGIGRAVAERFAAEGWDVCLNARRGEVVDEVAGELAPGDHVVCPGDYSDSAVAERMCATLGEKWGHVNALVNCAGVFKTVDAVADPLDRWRQCFDAMVFGGLAMSRVAARLMTDAGRIIHVTSIHADRGEAGASAYSMAKAALNQMCRALAIELAPRHILVNAIAPGFVDTPMSVVDGRNELESDWFRQSYVEGRHLPLKRPGRPEEIAGIALFLAGPDASYITGQTIVADGGLTITF